MEHGKIYLCKSDYSVLGVISGLKEETCNLKKNALDYWELTFEVYKYIDVDGELVQSDYYDSLNEKMYLYLDSEKMYFLIDSEPPVNNDGLQETKTVTAYSNECELNNIFLNNFKINYGTYDSQEYLADDNIDYNNLAKEYISLVNYGNEQLSLMHLALQKTGWKVAENIPNEICSIKKAFDVNNTSIYAFLMKTVSPSCKVVFQFNRKAKTINIIKVEDYGIDSGVNISVRNLLKSFTVTSSSEGGIITKMIPTGSNDNINILFVNFGENYILMLDYFMDTLNEYGDYKFVSTELHNKYGTWVNYRDKDLVNYKGENFTRRELYAYLTKKYHQSVLQINEIKNKVPNDGCNIDYTSWKYDELVVALNAYNNALNAIITLYKNEYGVTELGGYPDYSPTPSSSTNIKDTVYWNDFFSFKEQIIPAVEESLKVWCETDENGNLVVNEEGKFNYLEFGNPAYYTDSTIIKPVDSWVYELSLYGLDELQSKKKAWCECANLLFHKCFVAAGPIDNPTAYITADESGWNSLSEDDKHEFTTYSAFVKTLNNYLDYMSFEQRENSLVTYYENSKIKNKVCKGIVRQCDDAIEERVQQIAEIEAEQAEYSNARNELANSVTIDGCRINGIPLFSESDKIIITNLIKEEYYNNTNIISTNLDDIVSMVDIQQDLYDIAYEELYKKSRPQYSFTTELDNLFEIEEFKCMEENFDLGNYIWLYTDIYNDRSKNKLRLISISYNPIVFSDALTVQFSTMDKTLSGISDIIFLLGEEGIGGGGVGGGSSGSGGMYGENDANINISNSILNALLNTELFATSVNDVILDSLKANKGNFNSLFARSGVFESLELGELKISGDCLFDYIKSSNYEHGASGSMLNIKDGTFEFAGGKLMWDGMNLVIGGYASTDDLDEVSNSIINAIGNIEDLQSQIDGKIQIYFDSYVPTNYNLPASSWTTDEERSAHVDDLYYVVNNEEKNGKCYRYTLENNTYKWVVIEDAEVEKALEDAAKAQFTADGKAQVFVSQPYPPYDVGDLWAQGSSGDLMRCKNARETGSYVASDWEKASKYTDDSGLESVIQNLSSGTTTINGGCIKTGNIISNNYGGLTNYNDDLSNTRGSILKLLDGQFNFGGGKLKWNGSKLTIDGEGNFTGTVTADRLTANTSGTIAGWTFNEYGFYYGDQLLLSAESCRVDKDGFSMGNIFSSTKNGFTASTYDYKPLMYDYSINLDSSTLVSTESLSTVPGQSIPVSVKITFNQTDLSYINESSYGSFKYFINYSTYDKSGNVSYIRGSFTVNFIESGELIDKYCNNEFTENVILAQDTGLEEGVLSISSVGVETDGSTYYSSSKPQIKEVTTIINYKANRYVNYIMEQAVGTRISTYKGDSIISSSGIEIKKDEILFNNAVRLNKNEFYHDGIQYNSISSGSTLKIYNGSVGVSASSSKRYKNNISTILQEEINPKKIYDLNICSYNYNEGYLSKSDQRYGEKFIGFIAEDVYEKFPIACNLNVDGQPEMWEINILFPAAVKLIQEHHDEIIEIKKELIELKEKINDQQQNRETNTEC